MLGDKGLLGGLLGGNGGLLGGLLGGKPTAAALASGDFASADLQPVAMAISSQEHGLGHEMGASLSLAQQLQHSQLL